MHNAQTLFKSLSSSGVVVSAAYGTDNRTRKEIIIPTFNQHLCLWSEMTPVKSLTTGRPGT
jgi:hypothetical protein